MQYQYIPYIWLLMVSAVISLSLGIYALSRRRNSKGAISFILSMLVVTIWSLANALEMSATDFSTKLFWANVQYFAFGYSPVTLLALCLQFTGYDRWIQNKRILWFAIIPTITIILIWTDGMHGLMRYDMHMDYSGSFPVIAKKYGPVFFLHAVYAHSLNLAAGVILIRSLFFRNTVYRKQAAALLIGLCLIELPNILYISGISPVERFDITPIFIGPSGLVIAWGIFRLKLLDLVPLARTTVIETMDAGVMVLDLQNRVLDINPAFEKIVGLSASQISSRRADEVCGKIPELAKACMDSSITQTEFYLNTKETTRVYEVLLSPLTDSKGILIGRLAVTYDITEKKQAQQAFLKQQRKLAVIQERERMARDMHDNLGQVLGFINLQAQGIRQELINAGIEITTHKLNKLVDATQAAHHEIREYICNARNAAKLEKDFITELAKVIIRFEEQTGLRVKPDIPIDFTAQDLEPNVQLSVLNIVKEALNNIGKHAGADHVKIAFSLAREELSAAIEDDGMGFDVFNSHNGNQTRFGLDIMRERALEIGAQLDIESTPGKGSRIVLRVPISKGEGNRDETDVGR